jgi:hypothetical protein
MCNVLHLTDLKTTLAISTADGQKAFAGARGLNAKFRTAGGDKAKAPANGDRCQGLI